MKGRFVLKNKKRFVIFLAIIVFVVGVTVFFSVNGDAKGCEKPEYVKVYVAEGDTLWGIASSYKKPGRDIREFIYELKRINSLKSSELYIGQVIVIPK